MKTAKKAAGIVFSKDFWKKLMLYTALIVSGMLIVICYATFKDLQSKWDVFQIAYNNADMIRKIDWKNPIVEVKK